MEASVHAEADVRSSTATKRAHCDAADRPVRCASTWHSIDNVKYMFKGILRHNYGAGERLIHFKYQPQAQRKNAGK